jgi:hypothetical protein
LSNILCDYVMVDAFSTQTKTIEGKVVHELATDLSFEAQYWSSKPSSAGSIQAPDPPSNPAAAANRVRSVP